MEGVFVRFFHARRVPLRHVASLPFVMNRSHRWAAVCCLVVCLAVIAGCEKPRPVYSQYKDTIELKVGQTRQMELQNIPQGLTTADYTWSSETEAATVDKNGLVTARNPGKTRILAMAVLNGREHHERFLVTVPLVRGELRGLSIHKRNRANAKVAEVFDAAEDVPLLKGEKCFFEVFMDADNPILYEDEQFSWESSDPNLAKIHPALWKHSSPTHKVVEIHTLDVGESTLTVHFADGISKSIRLKIFESPDSFPYIKAMSQYQKPDIRNGTVYCKEPVLSRLWGKLPFEVNIMSYEIQIFPGSGELLQGFASAPQGKYAFILTTDLENEKIEGTINETSVIDFIATSMLPPELIPQSAAEIEYIMAIDFRAKQTGVYEQGTKAMQLYAVTSIKEAKTGKVLLSRFTAFGKVPPPKIHYRDGNLPEKAYGLFSEKQKRVMVQHLLSYIWSHEHKLNVKIGSR